MSKKINIRPTTSVYATYKNIKYDPWTAIAEFVDNSTQSYYSNEQLLKNTKYWNGLKVQITYDKDEDGVFYLEIKDNAYGMNFADFQRAIILDSKPKIATRSEFGMGLKTAACWFGLNWSVESTQLNSDVKYYTEVDVDSLSKYKNEEIEVTETQCNPKEHGTTIRIWNMNRSIIGRQVGKTKDQLRGMYRTDLRTGEIEISYNEEPLTFEESKLLVEDLPDGSKKEWKKNICFEIENLGNTYHVNGFVGILETGSVSGAGLTLIRRGRVIVGGYENGYRPEEIFGKSNDFSYQRIIGELNLDDWPVTQTKDAFDWYNGLEDKLIDELSVQCKDFVKKSQEYRKHGKKNETNIEKGINSLVDSFTQSNIINDVEISSLPTSLIEKIENEIENSTPKTVESNPEDDELVLIDNINEKVKGRTITFKCSGNEYKFNFILKEDDPESTWLNIIDGEEEGYNVTLNIKHPFFSPYLSEPDFLEIMEEFSFAFALAEIEARKTATNGQIDPGRIRLKMNESLKSVIGKDKYDD